MFDYVVLVMAVFFLVRGGWIGFMRQLAVFFALVGGYWLACRFSGLLIPSVGQLIENPRIIFLISFILLFLLSSAVFILFGKVLQKVMEVTMLTWFDRLLGLLLGGFKAFVVGSLLYMVILPTLSASNDLLRKSVSAPYLKEGAALIQAIIKDKRIRKEFNPKQPAIPAVMEMGEKAVHAMDKMMNGKPGVARPAPAHLPEGKKEGDQRRP